MSEIQHASDCAVHNAPALPVGECDCGAELSRLRTLLSTLMEAVEPFANAATNNSLRKDLEDKWTISYLVPITYGDLRRAREAYEEGAAQMRRSHGV